MGFKEYIEQDKVKKTITDNQKLKALIDNSEQYIKGLSKITIDDINSSMILSSYYEALRMIVEAIALEYHYNVYSHEALTSFIEEILKDERSAIQFDRYRKIRNGINYYGKKVNSEETKEHCKNIILLIQILKDKHLKK